MAKWLFWIALYAACVTAARIATPGLPEAMGFAVPAFGAAVLAAWFARKAAPQTRRLIATGIAVVLMLGAMTGVMGQAHDLAQQQARSVAAAPQV